MTNWKEVDLFNWLKENLNIIIPEWEINFKNPATTHFKNTNKVEKELAYLEITKAKQWKTT